jgi:ketosteroid isomerase-like protein
MKDIKELTVDYFNAFASKNEDQLKEMYADDFSLRDWLAEAKGKDKVLDLNKQFFGAYPDFELEVLETYIDGNVSVSEIVIRLTDNTPGETLTGKRTLLVVDVIEFSEEGKMNTLRAYFGN